MDLAHGGLSAPPASDSTPGRGEPRPWGLVQLDEFAYVNPFAVIAIDINHDEETIVHTVTGPIMVERTPKACADLLFAAVSEIFRIPDEVDPR
jgi:hypothetical protein